MLRVAGVVGSPMGGQAGFKGCGAWVRKREESHRRASPPPPFDKGGRGFRGCCGLREWWEIRRVVSRPFFDEGGVGGLLAGKPFLGVEEGARGVCMRGVGAEARGTPASL